MKADKQQENSKIPQQLQPHCWKKGQSGNWNGRPKGKTLKEYAREFLSCMTDEEKDEFMDGLPKELIWKMAEGNPDNKNDLTSNGESIQTLLVKFLDGKDNNNGDSSGIQEVV